MAEKDALSSSLERAREACTENYRARSKDARTVFRIDIPAQEVRIRSRSMTEAAIKVLKSIGVRGSYRKMEEVHDAGR